MSALPRHQALPPLTWYACGRGPRGLHTTPRALWLPPGSAAAAQVMMHDDAVATAHLTLWLAGSLTSFSFKGKRCSDVRGMSAW